MRRNTYEASTGHITLDPVQAAAFDHLYDYYSDVFSNSRDEYAIPANALSDPTKLRAMSAFSGGRHGRLPPTGRGRR